LLLVIVITSLTFHDIIEIYILIIVEKLTVDIGYF